MASSSSSSRSFKYDVFLSFRGEDTRKTFVDHLYKALEDRLVRTYKDDITLPRGESVGPALLKAIEESHIAVIVFSRNYADSSWCLDELVHIMKCREEMGLTVIPVFYDVDPSEVSNQKREFGKAFSKQEMKNATKAELWRKALVDASNISGWEPKNVSNGHEAAVIQNIVNAISDKLLLSNSDIDEELVGMTNRVEDLILRLEIGTGGVRMVGIWGVGGGGKTTLATSVYMKIIDQFQGHCIVDNIREESSKFGLKMLQENILNEVLKNNVRVQSVEQGKRMIQSRLCHSNVLILLDDVDDPKPLEALAGSHSWFGYGSRIIITTRNEHLLQKVDYVSPVRLLSQDEGNRLFKKHAYNDKKPLKDYWELSLRVVSYADGLPLAVKVLGSFLYDKDEKEWMSTLARLKDIPESEIVEKLKISYDGLKKVEKELFLDIACFFRGRRREDGAVELFEACGFHPDIGIKVLIQKALITIDLNGYFNMHDLVQEMGHYIVRGEHPDNPEKHSRVWKNKVIEKMCIVDATTENDKIEAIRYYNLSSPDLVRSQFVTFVSNLKKLRWIDVIMGNDDNVEGPNFLSNELRYIRWQNYPASPFPDSFQPMNLVVLKMVRSFRKELWRSHKRLPQLKVLQLISCKKLVSTPNFDGLPCLQKLELRFCDDLEEIHPSIGNHRSLKSVTVFLCPNLRMFPTIFKMEKLELLHIGYCHESLEFPDIQANMDSLVELHLYGIGIEGLLSSIGKRCTNLVSLDLGNCFIIKNIKVNFDGLKNLKDFRICSNRKAGNNFSNMVIDGNRLLQSMLQGATAENHCVSLQLQGLEIPKGFTPCLRDGNKCTLQLPENWCSDFCGFLMCVVAKNDFTNISSQAITIKQVITGGSMGMDSEDDVVWKESVGDEITWVVYIPFASLRHTNWWDSTDKKVSFSIYRRSWQSYREIDECINPYSGFGVRLVHRIGGSGPTEISTDSSGISDGKPGIEIKDDSKDFLTIISELSILW